MEIKLYNSAITNNDEFRTRIYSGEIFLLPATVSRTNLTVRLLQILNEQIKTVGGITNAQAELSSEQIIARHNNIKKILLTNFEMEPLLFAVLEELNFDLSHIAYDPIKMRIALHRGHLNPVTKRSNSLHRDTWYANPSCQINFWMPLVSVNRTNAFHFYEECFERNLPNTSEQFDYDQWMQTTGWQNSSGAGFFPEIHDACTSELGKKTFFSAEPGQLLIFSAAHLHKTTANDSGFPRFSVDFRVVDVEDLKKGIGARDVDNRSTGSALNGYRRPHQFSSADFFGRRNLEN
jgi:hypothetical protein